MEETECLLRKATSNKRLQESVKKMKNGSKDDFFGIWADKKQGVHAYMLDMRRGEIGI